MDACRARRLSTRVVFISDSGLCLVHFLIMNEDRYMRLTIVGL